MTGKVRNVPDEQAASQHHYLTNERMTNPFTGEYRRSRIKHTDR